MEASSKNKEFVAGKYVRLEKDVSDTDKYGRLLRYVYVEDDLINLELIKGGYANVYTYPPDVKFDEIFIQAEQDARLAKLGLWGDTCSDSDEEVVQTQTMNECNIKGNISSKKEKIYHVTGCLSYNKTVIDESVGERWFCTEQEALDAGWRKALNCN